MDQAYLYFDDKNEFSPFTVPLSMSIPSVLLCSNFLIWT